MCVETEIEAAARSVVKVDAAIAQLQIEPRGRSVVDGAEHLPVAIGAETKAANIAVGG